MENVLELKINTKDGAYSANLGEELKIDINDLNSSFVDQAGKYAWWSVLAAQARAQADVAKAQLDNYKDYVSKQLTGELDAKIRKELANAKIKSTESKIASAIYNEKEYVEAQDKLNTLRENYAKLNGEACVLESARESLNQRKDMLISLGAQLRAEQSATELSLKKNRAEEQLQAKGML